MHVGRLVRMLSPASGPRMTVAWTRAMAEIETYTNVRGTKEVKSTWLSERLAVAISSWRYPFPLIPRLAKWAY